MPKLHRLALTGLAFAAALAGPLDAQTSAPIIGVSITTSLPGGAFWVDGTEYRTSAHFLWPEGSKHNLEIRKPLQINEFCDRRWRFQGWTADQGPLSEGASTILVYTTHRSQTAIGANFSQEYRLDVVINDDPLILDRPCGDEAGFSNENEIRRPPNPMGFVNTGSASGFRPPREYAECLSTSGWSWIPAGTIVDLNAFPYPGYGFIGWEMAGAPTTGFLGQILVDRPWRIRARFAEARRATLVTAPQAGLNVVFDREIVRTRAPGGECLPVNGLPGTIVPHPDPDNPAPPFSNPGLPQTPYGVCRLIPLCNGDFDLLPGSEHILAAPTSQQDSMGNIWVFDRWDLGNGGEPSGQNTVVTIPQDYRPHTFTAHFVPGARVSFVTVPASLKLRVDGRENWPSYNFEWGVGHSHTFAAPLEQTDSKGRRWRFVGWSNEGSVEQEIVVPAEAATKGLRYIAQYELLGQLTLRSEPTSLTFSVNGEECTTPCVVDRPAGEEVVIAALPERSFSDDTRIEFSGWDDTGSIERTYAFTQDASTLTAHYQHLHRLTLLSDPGDGAKYTLTPAAGPGGFFTAGVRVDVKVEGNTGFKFRRWDGVLSGTYPSGSVTMNRPATIVARFDRVPALPEGAVQNAAGETPDAVVAPGSLIGVRGRHLAPGSEAGFFNPLKQTLLDVTVHVGERLLPLLFVSPEEIIAQLPSTVPPGEHELTVRQIDQPPVTAGFEVATHAPGLFTQPEQELPYAEIYHVDGTPVTPENPAKPGDTLLLTGTGFGRTNPHWLDGFATPEQPLLPLSNSIELLIEGEPHPHLWVGAQPNRVGRNLLRFVLGPVLPDPDSEGQNLHLRVRIHDRDSNTVLLPVAPPE